MFDHLDRLISSALKFLAKYGGDGVDQELSVLVLEESARRESRARAASRGVVRPEPPRLVVARWSLWTWLFWLWALASAYSLAHFVLFMLGVVTE